MRELKPSKEQVASQKLFAILASQRPRWLIVVYLFIQAFSVSLRLTSACVFVSQNDGINHGKNWKMESLFRPLLKELRQKLLKESWKKNPAAVECLRNIVEVANSTHIAENVASLMPIGLLLTDDFVLENRLIGVGIVSSLCEHMVGIVLSRDR